MADAVFFVAGAPGPIGSDLFYGVAVECVVNPGAAPVGLDHSAFRKDFHVIGKRRLCDIEIFQDITSAKLAAG